MSDTQGADKQGYFGQKGISDDASLFHWVHFIVRQVVSEVRTSTPVKIKKVSGGGVGPAPTVDFQPLVKQMDGAGNSSSHGTVYSAQTKRVQGGKNAIIMDPVVDDIGHVIVSDRDISSVVANAGEANPGSFRRHDLADAVYHGAMINPATPTQYTHYKDQGVDRQDNQGNTISTGAEGIKHLASMANAAIKLVTSGTSGLISLATSAANAAISHATTGDNAPISQSTTGNNSPLTFTTSGTNSPISMSSSGTMGISSGGAMSISAPSLTLPPVTLSGDVTGTTSATRVVGASTIPTYSSNALAAAGGLAVGKLYANPSISGSEYVLCVRH